MNSEQYETREDGMFKDYDTAIKVIHDLSQLIDVILDTATIYGKPVQDVIDGSVVESLGVISANVHYASCKRIRTAGIIKEDGSIDMEKYQEALLEMMLGNPPLADIEPEPTITINGLVEQQLRDILNNKQV